jgi:hypothetical protein
MADLFRKFLSKQRTTSDARRTARVNQRGGGGGFSDRFDPPQIDEGAEPASIVLFPGNYAMDVKVGKKGELDKLEREYFLTFEHFFATKQRGGTCRAGLKLERVGDGAELVVGDDDCPACYLIDKEGVESINRRLLHVFNAVLLGHFHIIDSDRMDKENKPYKEYVPCDGKRCKHCSNGAEKTYGRRVYWQLGKRGVNTLMSHADSTLSRHCKCGGKLEPVGFECPECHEILIDLAEDGLSAKELQGYRTREQKCPNCGAKDLPVEVPECDSCKDAKPLTIWDVQLEVGKQGKKTESNIMITGWSPLTEKTLAKIEKKLRPYEFDKMLFKKPTCEQLAKKMGIPNPFESDDEERGSVKWKKDRDEGDERSRRRQEEEDDEA